MDLNFVIKRSVVLGFSLAAVWLILLCMSVQGFVCLAGPLGGLLPVRIVAAFWGFWGATPFLLFFPALVATTLGVVGLPPSWEHAVEELFLALEPTESSIRILITWATNVNTQATGAVRTAVDTTLRVLVPFYSYFVLEEDGEHPPDPRNQPYAPERNDEIWIYVNGIATPRAIADRNCAKLNKLFHRRVILVHNSSNSVWFDLIQCVVGKIGLFRDRIDVAPRRILKESIKKHLTTVQKRSGGLKRIIRGEIKRVVLISHSQGTIITGNALSELFREEDAEFLARTRQVLEVYNFATCSHDMPAEHVRHMENIGNRGDVVAWLGMLFPLPALWPDVDGRTVRIDGQNVVEEGGWGHLLNTHYLIPLHREGKYATSRLRTYLKQSRVPAIASRDRPRIAAAPEEAEVKFV